MIILNEFVASDTQVCIICGDYELTLEKQPNIKYYKLLDYYTSREESIENIKKGVNLAVKEITTEFDFY